MDFMTLMKIASKKKVTNYKAGLSSSFIYLQTMKYTIKVREISTCSVEVETASEDEAYEIVENMYSNDELNESLLTSSVELNVVHSGDAA